MAGWVLLFLPSFGKGDKPERVIAKISQDTLAKMLGTLCFRGSVFLNTF